MLFWKFGQISAPSPPQKPSPAIYFDLRLTLGWPTESFFVKLSQQLHFLILLLLLWFSDFVRLKANGKLQIAQLREILAPSLFALQRIVVSQVTEATAAIDLSVLRFLFLFLISNLVLMSLRLRFIGSWILPNLGENI